MSTIRLVLGMVAAENLHLEQLDVKTAFLHGDLEEDLYMIQPEGFIVQGQENLVCKLRKSLYGLKQAPRQWYKKFDNFMHRIGFKRCEADLVAMLRSDIEKINNLKKQLSKQFAMKDLGAAKQILGMRIIRDKANGTLKLSQSEYVKKVLSRFNMNEAKPVSTPLGSHFKLSKEQSPKTEEERDHMSKVPYASAIGSLMYAMVCTRPDIAHAVGVVSRFMSRPGKQHWEAVKWILRYLKGSLDTCLCFTGASLKLQGYVDADFAGDIDSRKSTTGFVFTLGGTAISWTSNLQKIVTLSTTEAEYVAATEAGKEMIWLHGFLDELGKKQEMGILHSDSQSAIFLAKNSAFHSKSKHIQTKYHFIRYLVEDKLVILEKICGSKNPADMLTKGVTIEKLKLCAASIGLLA
ncbi:Retrovirus-related Pol polyprotein from transposon TNT 1-94 [Vitis vinifera]|uniref:Retrovirus-related Pol polyprotein from transposon TNT 1-94 n=1 Tax=Vitis vinifera TaxID=29760 RepID=A0A438FG00_VITVI|nr:Retrovirus-related Pol polyprotein from transposon TNT 1-94 [Vitis vinifera]